MIKLSVPTTWVQGLWGGSPAERQAARWIEAVARMLISSSEDGLGEGNRFDSPFRSYTAAEIADAGHAVNTRDKLEGKVVRDATNTRLMVASGDQPTDDWDVCDGSGSVTPS